MTQVDIDNKPVSKVVSSEKITIPTGEVWKVTIHASGDNINNGKIKINGQMVAYLDGFDQTTLSDVILKGGDTLTVNGYDNQLGAHVSGFVVSQ